MVGPLASPPDPGLKPGFGSCGAQSVTRPAGKGRASGFPVTRGLNSTEGTQNCYSRRWVRALKGIVSRTRCGVVPAFLSQSLDGPRG